MIFVINLTQSVLVKYHQTSSNHPEGRSDNSGFLKFITEFSIYLAESSRNFDSILL